MPFKRRITDVERSIEELRAAIETARGNKSDKPKLEKLLGELARMRAERLRLMDHQLLISK